ncbi:ZU5 domain protein, partial [Ancylostoma caninum]
MGTVNRLCKKEMEVVAHEKKMQQTIMGTIRRLSRRILSIYLSSTSSFALQDFVCLQEPTIVEETNAVVGSEGGVLNCPVSGVELRIPKGAIPPGEKHEIYVKVCRDGDSPPIDKSKGETLLSPLVMCGPQGLFF